MATEEVKEMVHTTYVGYEFGREAISHPFIAHRCQNGPYVLDVNGGYKYINTTFFPMHLGKFGINAYKILHQTNKGQLYYGIGTDFIAVKYKSSYGRKKKDRALQPSVTVGHDFNIEDCKKAFFELIYNPYSFGKYENTSIHSIRCRMGIGF